MVLPNVTATPAHLGCSVLGNIAPVAFALHCCQHYEHARSHAPGNFGGRITGRLHSLVARVSFFVLIQTIFEPGHADIEIRIFPQHGVNAPPIGPGRVYRCVGVAIPVTEKKSEHLPEN